MQVQRFRLLALTATLLALGVVVLGAYVRLTDAGLGCPDWPGCYGQLVVPDAAAIDTSVEIFQSRPLDEGKAWREMAHRYLAGMLGVLIVVLALLAWWNREDLRQSVILPFLLVGLVIIQVLLGMWTVTLLLKPSIVTMHLLGGMAILGLLWWLSLTTGRSVSLSSGGLRRFAALALIVLGVQIALGGWTSANYAALACPDFPTCQGSWWPNADFREGFILWRGAGIDYEGGVLEHPTRVAIHIVHRVGAVITLLFIGLLSGWMVARAPEPRQRQAGWILGFLLLSQVVGGVLMIRFGLPLFLATAHNAGAALLVLGLIYVNYTFRYAEE